MSVTLRETPLSEEHRRLGAKMVPFAGYTMPVQYPSGIQAEHRTVREAAGLFDVSHMGEIAIQGPEALALVQHVTVNDASLLDVGRAQYSAFCREDGGMLDDVIVYRVGEDLYVIVVNASNHERDLAWILAHQPGRDAQVVNRSERTALLALQGPLSQAVLAPLVGVDLGTLGPSRLVATSVAGSPGLVARTGYTGEDGFEIFIDPESALAVWRAILDAGAGRGVAPIGLGARDSLRLEVGYPLYGNDLDEEHTPLEAGLGWIVKFGKGDFVGRDALARQREGGLSRQLAGIRLQENGFPRPGYPVVAEGEEVGTVTSGTLSPTLGSGIALAYLPVELTPSGTPVAIRIRGRDLKGAVHPRPFYAGGSRRR